MSCVPLRPLAFLGPVPAIRKAEYPITAIAGPEKEKRKTHGENRTTNHEPQKRENDSHRGETGQVDDCSLASGMHSGWVRATSSPPEHVSIPWTGRGSGWDNQDPSRWKRKRNDGTLMRPSSGTPCNSCSKAANRSSNWPKIWASVPGTCGTGSDATARPPRCAAPKPWKPNCASCAGKTNTCAPSVTF
jgi:hypothetical protein